MENTMLRVKIKDLGIKHINKIVEVDITNGIPNNSIADLFIGVAKKYLLKGEVCAVAKNSYTCDIVAGYGKKIGELSIVK